jgi:hypothetical protein
MSNSQIVGIVVNAGIYVALIAFVLYRQMTAQPLRPQRLVLLPLLLGAFAIQQISGQHLSAAFGTVAYLGVNFIVGIVLGVWRGTTFRLWSEVGTVMMRGTWVTLVAWGVLIVIRAGFALATHAVRYGQGVVIGELLLALAVTFAAQNVVIWMRAGRLAAGPAASGEAALLGRNSIAYSGTPHPPD